MNLSLDDLLANLPGVNTAFVKDCIAAGPSREAKVMKLLRAFKLAGPESIHVLNQKIWRLRNLRRRTFDARSFAPDVLRGLGFDTTILDRAVRTGKLSKAEVEEAVVQVCRGFWTVKSVHEIVAHVEPKAVPAAVEVEPRVLDYDAMVALGFDADLLNECVFSRGVVWGDIEKAIGNVVCGRNHLDPQTVDAIQSQFVHRACAKYRARNRGARADQLDAMYHSRRGESFRRAA